MTLEGASTRTARMRDSNKRMRRKRKQNLKRRTKLALRRRRKTTVRGLIPMLPMMPAKALHPGRPKALSQR